MKYFFLQLTIYSAQLFGQTDLQKKFPTTLLTDDYGILNTADLSTDPSAIPPKWQCFKTKDITFSYNTWKAPDPEEDENINVSLCLYSFRVKNVDQIHYYEGRNTYRLAVCKSMQNSWRKITIGQTHACLNGYNNGRLEKIKKGKGFQYETRWIWSKFKTRKGCDDWYWCD